MGMEVFGQVWVWVLQNGCIFFSEGARSKSEKKDGEQGTSGSGRKQRSVEEIMLMWCPLVVKTSKHRCVFCFPYHI